jgi:hypothetical protein
MAQRGGGEPYSSIAVEGEEGNHNSSIAVEGEEGNTGTKEGGVRSSRRWAGYEVGWGGKASQWQGHGPREACQHTYGGPEVSIRRVNRRRRLTRAEGEVVH